MIISKYLQKLFFLLMVGGALCTLQACGDDEEDEPVQNPNEEEIVKPDDGKEEEKPSDKPSDTMEAVDLGLPSGLKWATCNVGASKPEEYGDYFAWGETEEKNFDDYDKNGYKFYNNSTDEYENIGSDISGSQYDVAHVKWGGNWRMPTLDEIKELVEKCTWKHINSNEARGQLVTGPNGNSILLPYTGYRRGDTNPKNIYYAGYYLSATSSEYSIWDNSALIVSFDEDGGELYDFNRCEGLAVRPVTE